MALGEVELYNSARLAAYLESVGSPLDTTGGVCGCDTLTADMVGDLPYTTPAEDGAPWYDPNVASSAEFAGLLVLSVDGMDDHPVERTVTRSVTGGAATGTGRVLPRTITVTAVLLGASCCGVSYGLRWLAQALRGRTGSGCGGDSLTVYDCCPGNAVTPEEFAARHRRTLRRVSLTSGPQVIARTGTGCASGGCRSGADILTVEWVMTAATPWLWTDPQPVLDVLVPNDNGVGCITWCLHGEGARQRSFCIPLHTTPCVVGDGSVQVAFTDQPCAVAWPDTNVPLAPCDRACRLAPCPDPATLCGDPSCRTPTSPVAPAAASTCFCRAVAVNEAFYDLDLTGRPAAFGAAPLITVEAGSAPLRRVTVTLYERRPEHEGMSCEEIAELERCDPHSVFEIGYVPAGGVLTLDGQTGRATVECVGVREGSANAYGRDGGPLSFPLLDSDRYCVQIAADAIATPAPDASVAIALSGHDY